MKDFNKIKIIKILIVFLLIMIIIVFLVIKGMNKEDNDFSYIGDEIDEEEYSKNTIELVDNKNNYFEIKRIINTYLQYIKQIKGIIDFQKYEDQEVIDDGIDKLYSILDKEYIDKMDIEKEDLSTLIKEYEYYNVEIQKMYKYEKNALIDLYFVYGNIDDEEFLILVKTDKANLTFSIFLQDFMEEMKYNAEMNPDEIKILENQIEKNDNNQYKFANITDEYIAIEYMDKIKSELIYNPKYVYNNLFEDEYKKLRFGNINNFIKYVNENEEDIENIEVKQYLVNSYDEYKEYVCKDQYENTYIFKENAVMDFTFRLDTYTINTDKFKTTYEKAQDEKKVQMNIDKFFQMLNRHDYRSSYNCLADSFKNNYFNTEEEFEEYAKDKFFSYNKIEFKSCEKAGADIYVFKVKIIDLLDEDNQSEVSIIMQLKDDFDFKMSFDI